MRIYLTCAKCLELNQHPLQSLTVVPIQDGGHYRLICTEGHETVTCLQQMKFEILFELGLHALADGYSREAVVSFAGALERLYEFFLRFQSHKAGIEEETFAVAWRHVSAQSERQLGAFIFAHALLTRECPSLLSPDDAKFRNEVVHKGKIPTEEEAVAFGEHVSALMFSVLERMRRDDSEALRMAVVRHVTQLARDANGLARSSMSIPTFICVTQMQPKPNLRERLSAIKKHRHFTRPV